jgi:threonine/homoserine/homoserine lactone efflux protein
MMPPRVRLDELPGVGDAIGQALPLAIGVAISPLPIVAVVLMLVTPRGRSNGCAFVLGWVVGLAIVGAVALLAASGAGASDEGEPATWVGLLKLALGLLALMLAVRQLRARGGAEPETPKWMRALDRVTPLKAAGMGALLSGANPKNLLLAVAGATTIAQAGIEAGEQALAYGVFVLVATLGVALPVALALALGERSRRVLDDLEDWLTTNNAVIMGVLMGVIGVKLIGDAITAL